MHPAPSAAPTPTLPDLNDTRIAFAHMSDGDLWRAEQLFKVIGNAHVTAVCSALTKVALALHLPINALVKATIFRQFCGGETIEESLHTATALARQRVGTILDHSVEGQESEAALDHNVNEVLRTISVASTRADIPFCVFKPTGLARFALLEVVAQGRYYEADSNIAATPLLAEWRQAEARMEKICEAAHSAGVRVLVDAEESWVQPAVDALAERMMLRYNRDRAIIFNTVQLYRHDRLAYLQQAYADAESKGYHLGLKLVRGAYMEKERARARELGYQDPIQPDKAASDRDYDLALHYCAERLHRSSLCVGTHNEASTLLMASLMAELGLARNDDRVWFAQLLGMSDTISYNMSAAGFNVAKYVPYGPVREVLPYLLRRANENTSARGQSGRELTLLRTERMRRAKR
jgi:proline dehydrogenase